MSAFGGFGGFGQNNNNNTNQQQNTGFGGFGANNNSTTNTGFGANNNAFGSTANNTTGGGLFGNTSTNTSGGFGTGGGFGSTTSGFGAAKPAFGASNTTTGGLFGSNNNTTTTNTGFGGGSGFGTNTTSTSSGFGGGSSLFGGNKGFGTGSTTAVTTPGSSLFGSGGFGSTGGSTFGATANPGLGTNVGDPPGTGVVPFQPTVEKEAANPQQSNKFENILFMDSYKKWSSDELRLADYNKGQKMGNAGGAFGGTGFGGTGFGSTTQSTGGFGSTNATTGGSLFGNTGSTGTGFGATSTNTGTGGFGGGTGLFGQNKPASTGLFGATTSQPAQTGGLFGSTTGTGGFGSTATTSGGFGQTQPAASTGLFGSAASTGTGFGATSTGTGTGFGQTSTTTGFGTNNTSTPFGGTSTTQTGGGLFGNAGNTGGAGLFGGGAQQQPSTGGFGSGFGTQTQPTGGGLFGGQQAKPGGLFGQTSTTGTGSGLFGNAGTSANPFGGAASTQQTGGGLFGSKPATGTSTGLFGSNPAGQQTGGGGLFGGLGTSTQTQQSGGTGLFGGLGQSQQAKPSVFGGSQGTGGGLFGGQQPQQSGGLFGAPQQQQPQQTGLGSSIFGTPQNAQAGPQSLTTSVNDISAFGATSLFANLGGAETPNPGPLATPLSGNLHKARSRSILPLYKMSPANSSAYATPQRRGFGFSYSNFGTPNSPSSVASTPSKMGQSLMVGSISRGLNKSISASNLRRSYNVEDSILPSGAFSASSSSRFYGSTGSHKKLIINREMRSDLFSSPNREKQPAEPAPSARKLSKRVSFEASAGGPQENGAESGSESAGPAAPTPQELGYLRPSNRSSHGNSNGAQSSKNGAPADAEPVKGNELAIVHEEESPVQAPTKSSTPGSDREAGEYWMQPSREEIERMNRMQKQKVSDFTVGRENVGSIQFKFPVDLSNINLDELFGGTVDFAIRSATVYPNPAKKPPVGKGLNVPAVITLEQSWPRDSRKKKMDDKSGAKLNRHIERLKKIPNTTFIDYDKQTGVWTFSVEHFTTYGLDDSDDEDEEEQPAPHRSEPAHDVVSSSPKHYVDAEDATSADGFEEDDFQRRSKRRAVPGAFGGDYESADEDEVSPPAKTTSRSGPLIAHSSPPEMRERPHYDDMLAAQAAVDDQGNDSYLFETTGMDVEHEHPEFEDEHGHEQLPGGVLRARMRALRESAMPQDVKVAGGDDWSASLHQQISAGQRTDRAVLRGLKNQAAMAEEDLQASGAAEAAPGASLMMSKQRVISDGAGFATSIDLMNSLFDQAKAPGPKVHASPARGFLKWPYQNQMQASQAEGQEEANVAYRRTVRPCWGPDGTLIYSTLANASPADAGLTGAVEEEQQLLNVVRLVQPDSKLASSEVLEAHLRLQSMQLVNGVPTTTPKPAGSIKAYIDGTSEEANSQYEKTIWEVASILFDELPGGTNTRATDEHQSRRAKLSEFWEKLVEKDTDEAVAAAQLSEEKAIAALAGHRVTDACKYLLEGKNFRLATLVSLIGTSAAAKEDIQRQIESWKGSNAIAEMSDAIRALYGLLAGEVGLCTGKSKNDAPVEDQARSFVISQRFGLNWKQAFGLRLWYATYPGDNIADAVDMYDKDVAIGREHKPKPWYIQQDVASSWPADGEAGGEDELWALLKLCAGRCAGFGDVLAQRNISLGPWDTRLAWQLGRALLNTGRFTLPRQQSDAASLAFAEQLTAEGHWILAIWVLSHLSSASLRSKTIQDQLARRAGHLIQNPAAWKELRSHPWLPLPMAYEGLALWCRSVEQDGVMELDFLRKAGNYREAHQALVTKVGPQAIIERDWDLLWMAEALKGHVVEIPEWGLGGAVYALYRQFRMGLKGVGKGHAGGGVVRIDVVEKLLALLKEVKKGDARMQVEQRAAVQLMTSQLREVLQDVLSRA